MWQWAAEHRNVFFRCALPLGRISGFANFEAGLGGQTLAFFRREGATRWEQEFPLSREEADRRYQHGQFGLPIRQLDSGHRVAVEQAA